MVLEIIFRSIFWIGVATIVTSLFLDFNSSLATFFMVLGYGLLLVIYSLYEEYLLKKTFQRPLSLERPLQEQQPISSEKKIGTASLTPLPSPKKPSFFSHLRFFTKPLPSDKREEHYIPTGAEQLAHDHHNRYAETRETFSQPLDKRYQQAGQQRTPTSHHLSLLHYLHTQDKRQEKRFFTVFLLLSFLLLAVGFFLYTSYFFFSLVALLLGFLFLAGSLVEFFSYHRHPSQSTLQQTQVPIASLDNLKQLFEEELHMQQKPFPGTFQRPASLAPIAFSKKSSQTPLPQPLASSHQQTPSFVEGLEHYIPTGAEQLAHDHHNRYAETRETFSQPLDKRYQQAGQQRTPTSHHLSLLHYLHTQDKRQERRRFVILLLLSILLIAFSLTLPFEDYLAFVVTLFFLGLLLFSVSLAEMIHIRHHTSLQEPIIAQHPQASSVLSPAQLQKKFISEPTLKPVVQSSQKIPAEPEQRTENISTLIAYVQQSLQQHYSLDAIRSAAKQSGWPEHLIEEAILGTKNRVGKKRKVITLLILVLLLLGGLFALNSEDMLLVPYWLQLLSDASPQFYYTMLGVFVFIIFLFVLKVHKIYKTKKINYRIQEEEQVADIKQELQKLPSVDIRTGSYETDFDHVYQLLSEKKKLTLTEVSQGFGISRKEAEEWGKILKEQGLIELHYPTVGDLEFLWKK